MTKLPCDPMDTFERERERLEVERDMWEKEQEEYRTVALETPIKRDPFCNGCDLLDASRAALDKLCQGGRGGCVP